MFNSEPENRTWLQRVQEQSWEPEILISGIVLFALFQIPPYIREGADYLNTYSTTIFSNGTFDEVLSAMLLSANYWLIFGFTTHLISRSIWAAFVGLSYVYKDGIQLDKLKYEEKYKTIIAKNSDYIAQIVKLEKFCSRIFAISFLLFMCTLGVVFFMICVGGVIGILYEIWPESVTDVGWIDPALGVISFVYVFDFLTLGLIKRIPVVNKIYYPFYKFMSFLTLSPLYRSIYYGFVSNHKKWKVIVGMSIFVTVTIVMTISIRDDQNLLRTTTLLVDEGDDYMFPGNYMNLAGDEPSKRMMIESDVIYNNVAKVLIVHSGQVEEESMLEQCNYDSLVETGIENVDSLHLECLRNFYTLHLNDQEINPALYYYRDASINREGLMGYVDLSELPRGVHELKLYYNFLQDGERNPVMYSDIEFFKDAPMEIKEFVGDSLQTSTSPQKP